MKSERILSFNLAQKLSIEEVDLIHASGSHATQNLTGQRGAPDFIVDGTIDF